MLYFDIFGQHAADKLAFIFKGQEMIYGELRHKIEQWANYLQAQGVERGDKVGLFSKNCTNFVVAYFAIIKAGGVVVPFNFQLAAREVAYIVKDAGMKFLINRVSLDLDEALSEQGLTGKLKQYTYEDLDEAVEHDFVDYQMQEDDNCTIIYTSGTTGKPKGAMLSHKNLIANARGYTLVVDIYPEDMTLCVLPMYHCFAWTVSVAGVLMHGATIVVQETYIFKDTMNLLAKYQVTTFVGVPTMMQLFLKGATAEELKNIRYFSSGGVAVPRIVAEQFKAKIGKYVREG